MQKNAKKILLTGGGTGGSVAPLLAIADELPLCDFFWIGTKKGPEKAMVEAAGVRFRPIFSGKLRRYFSWRNFVDPFLIMLGFVQSFFIILKWRPDLVMSAGSFASVPAVWAAWLLRVPVLIHQQDERPGLANKLMAPFARAITVAFKKSLADYGGKAVWIGNPIRQSLKIKNKKQKIKNYFNLNNNLPVVLVIGGGTGAMAINELIGKALPELTKFCQIIHITGKDKKPNIQYPPAARPAAGQAISNIQFFDFLDAEKMADAYAAADIVVSRCGMGVLTELSYLGKPAILIPMPDSHQEENAAIFAEKQAAIVLAQKELTQEKLADNIKKLLNDEISRDKLSGNVREVMKQGANEKMVEIINDIINKKQGHKIQ